MKKNTFQTSKSMLLAGIASLKEQVEILDRKDEELARISKQITILEKERALLIAISDYVNLGTNSGVYPWALAGHLASATALLEKVVREKINA